MTLKEYCAIKLKNHERLNVEEKKKLLLEIYSEMEKRGHHHTEIFATINDIALEKIRRAKIELMQSVRKLENLNHLQYEEEL